jgi:hypothetical protein
MSAGHLGCAIEIALWRPKEPGSFQRRCRQFQIRTAAGAEGTPVDDLAQRKIGLSSHRQDAAATAIETAAAKIVTAN